MRLFGSLTKIEDQPDGTLKVYGVASTGARDDAGEIVRPEAMRAALPDYARYPALREMHQPTAAGRTLEASVDDDGATRIVAHVVDPVAIAKVRSRTYSGFSIGGRVLARDPKDQTVITKIKLSEISLVDRPANPEAVIDLWKADLEAPRPPGNDAVKARAAQMARLAGYPGTWKNFVAKARAALIDEQTNGDVGAEDEGEAASEDPSPGDPQPSPDETHDASDDPMDQADSDIAPEAATEDGDSDAAVDADGTFDTAAADDDAADTDEYADNASRDAAAVGASLSALAGACPTALQALHDALAALGCECDPTNCGGLGKIDVPVSVQALAETDLAKALHRVDVLERRLAEQSDLVERLAATPLPARTAASPHARLVGKVEDADPSAGDPISAADVQKAFAALSTDERAFLLMKASLRQPIPIL